MRFSAVLLAIGLPFGFVSEQNALARKLAAFYVAPEGSDASPGTREAPVATLAKAIQLAESQPAPAEVVVRGGLYLLERTVSVQRSQKTSRLTIRAAEGETPVFDGSVPLEKATPLKGAPGVYTLKGKFPTDEPPTIWEEATSRHFVKLADIESVKVSDSSSTILDETTLAIRCRDGMEPAEAGVRMSQGNVFYGIRILRDNVTVRGLEFRNFVVARSSCPLVIGGPAMVTGGRKGREREGTFTANAIIESCVVRNCYFGFRVWINGLKTRFVRNRGRNCVTGIWVSGIETTIEYCEFINDPDWHSDKLKWDRTFDRKGFSFYNGPEDAVIRHNFVKGFRTGVFSKWSPGTYVIENNTFVDGQTAIAPDPGLMVRRNIFAGYPTPFSDERGKDENMDYNIFWARNNFQKLITDKSRGCGPNNKFADPLFASPRRGDYRLLPGSPAIGLEGKDYAGAFPPVPDGYPGAHHLRVSLVHIQGTHISDPYPLADTPPSDSYVSQRRTVKISLNDLCYAQHLTRLRIHSE